MLFSTIVAVINIFLNFLDFSNWVYHLEVLYNEINK